MSDGKLKEEELLAQLAKLSALVEERDAKLEEQNAKLEERNAKLEETAAKLERYERLVERMQEQLKSVLAQKYGRSSEKLTAEELGQLVLAWGGDPEQTDPKLPHDDTDDAEPPGDEQPKSSKKGRYRNGHPGRSPLGEDLERIVHEHAVPDDERACEHCGVEMTCIKHVDHERVEYVPAKLVVHVDRREVLACKEDDCEGEAVTADRGAPAAPRCRIGHSLAAHLIEAKCQDGMPVERQRNQLGRLGFDVAPETLYAVWNRSLDKLRIVGDALLGEILAEWYVQLDDTRLDVLDRNHKNGKQRGHLWCFVGASRKVGYHFTETWTADEIAPVLFQIDGFAQTDDWPTYDSQVKDEHGKLRKLIDPDRRLGCGMHTRRKFYEDKKLGGKGSAAALVYWKQLYEVEAYAKKKGLDPGARHELRQEKSVPIMTAFDAWVDEQLPITRPTSRLGKALKYAQKQRPYLHRCLTDGRFEIDNGNPERQIRRPAVGRKNWLFTGSANGGRRLATAHSLVQTCIALDIPVAAYLTDVLTKIDAGWSTRRLSELLPARWNELHRRG